MQEENNTYETPEQTMEQKKKFKIETMAVPLSIIIAGIIISLSIIFSGGGGPLSDSRENTQVANNREVNQETPEVNVATVTSDDHILGNPNAEVMIVEYSDFDCPFCKNFHTTMNRIMSEYGETGKVAWVYRHFPIKQLHPNAERIAEASECVADLGGNNAFWTFADLVFDERGTNEPTDMARLPEFAERSGVNVAAYNNCIEEGKFAQKIQDDIKAAAAAGARGTPYSIVLTDDQQGTINGAQQYNTVKQIIEGLLPELKEGA